MELLSDRIIQSGVKFYEFYESGPTLSKMVIFGSAFVASVSCVVGLKTYFEYKYLNSIEAENEEGKKILNRSVILKTIKILLCAELIGSGIGFLVAEVFGNRAMSIGFRPYIQSIRNFFSEKMPQLGEQNTPPISQLSVFVITSGTVLGIMGAKKMLNSDLSTREKVGCFAVSMLGAIVAGYEIYANGVNLGYIQKL